MKSAFQTINELMSSHVNGKFSKPDNISVAGGSDWYGLTTKLRRLSSAVINKTSGTITATFEGLSVSEIITYTETDTSMTFTFPDSFTTTVSIS